MTVDAGTGAGMGAGASAGAGADTLRLARTIAADAPWFRGHFPEQPIVPGIAHLALVSELLGEARPLCGVGQLKLRRLVGPGDAIELTCSTADASGSVRFELRAGGEVSSSGSVRVGEAGGSAGAVPAWTAPAGVDPGPVPAPDTFVPHRPPMLLIERPLARLADGLVGCASIPRDNPFVMGSGAPPFVALELAAQTAALFEALKRRDEGGAGEPRVGYLVGARDVTFHAPALPVATPLEVAIELTGLAWPLSVYRMTVAHEGRALAQGSISTYIAGS